MQIFENMESRVESDKVDHLERPHGMIQAQLQRFINIPGGGNSLLQHVERFVTNHGIDAAGDESGRFFDHDDFLAHTAADFHGRGKGLIVGGRSSEPARLRGQAV